MRKQRKGIDKPAMQSPQKKRVVQSAEQPTKKGRTGQSMPLQSDVQAMQLCL